MHLKIYSYRPVDRVPQSKNPHQEHYLSEDLKWSIHVHYFPIATSCMNPMNCELLWDLV